MENIVRPTFDQTVSVLVKAYLNGTLEHGNCYACAVGNIVAHGLGTEVVHQPHDFRMISWSNNAPYPGESKDVSKAGWGAAFCSDFTEDGDDRRQMIHKTALKIPSVEKQIKASGYTWQELARIEFAFENVVSDTKQDRMFNGLMAVCDTLAEIHGINLQEKQEAKSLFCKV